MLKQRIITAVIVAAFFLGAVVALPVQWFVVLSGVILLVAAWEWAGLCGFSKSLAKVLYCLLLLALYVLIIYLLSGVPFSGIPTLGFSFLFVLFWLGVLRGVCGFPDQVGFIRSYHFRFSAGFFLLLPTVLSLVYLKTQQPAGELILIVVAVIAIADTGAYFSGKKFGKRKLAINVSPGKTWEGVAGGLLANLAFALVLVAWLDLAAVSAVVLVITILLADGLSVLGDLFVSMIKRIVGVKDTGKILPGHGGILDRIDGWTAAMPFFALVHILSAGLVNQ